MRLGCCGTPRLVTVPGLSTALRVSAGRRSGEAARACRPCLRLLWKCAECACLGIKNSTLARAHLASYVVVAKPRTDHFRCGETRPIARPVRIAVAPRCAVQEVDPRFSRLAALTLVNRMAASHPGMEAGAPEAKPQTLQFRRRLKEEERGSESPTPGYQRVGRPAFPSGTAGRSVVSRPTTRAPLPPAHGTDRRSLSSTTPGAAAGPTGAAPASVRCRPSHDRRLPDGSAASRSSHQAADPRS
jgi:hypothetical protein